MKAITIIARDDVIYSRKLRYRSHRRLFAIFLPLTRLRFHGI